MCLICVEFQKERMTVGEARRAYTEMVVDMEPTHAREVRRMLDEAEKEKEKAAQKAASDDD